MLKKGRSISEIALPLVSGMKELMKVNFIVLVICYHVYGYIFYKKKMRLILFTTLAVSFMVDVYMMTKFFENGTVSFFH